MNLNPFKKKNLNELLIITAIQLGSFLVLYILSRTILLNFYLLKWTADEYYLYLWIPVIICTLFNKTIISLFLTIGNLFGILLGQIMGDIIKYINVQKINDSMTEGEKYHLMNHKGAYIWMLTILIFLVLGLITSYIYKKSDKAVYTKN